MRFQISDIGLGVFAPQPLGTRLLTRSNFLARASFLLSCYSLRHKDLHVGTSRDSTSPSPVVDELGSRHLYLYTDSAINYYERFVCSTIDRIDWKSFPTALMAREL
jgi:hypothetical protein